eukprot:4476193-Prymnesium_polylepis.1
MAAETDRIRADLPRATERGDAGITRAGRSKIIRRADRSLADRGRHSSAARRARSPAILAIVARAGEFIGPGADAIVVEPRQPSS